MERVSKPYSVGIGFYSPKTFLSFIKRNLINSDYTDIFFSFKRADGDRFVYKKKEVLISISSSEARKNWHSFIIYEPMCEFKDRFLKEVDLSSIKKEPLHIYAIKTLQEINFPLSKRLSLSRTDIQSIRKFVDHSLFFRIDEVRSSSLETPFTIL